MFGFFNKGDKSHDKKTQDKNIIYSLNDKDDKVVYVGSSRRGTARIHEHKDKDYNSCNYETVNPNSMLKEEKEYIEKYNPKYNKDNGQNTRSVKGSNDNINVKKLR